MIRFPQSTSRLLRFLFTSLKVLIFHIYYSIFSLHESEMRPESAPQYALGKKALSFYAAKMSGKTSAAPTIISFFRCERKTSKYYYYHRNKEKSGLIRKLNSKKKCPPSIVFHYESERITKGCVHVLFLKNKCRQLN